MNPTAQIHAHGQSLWLDNITRSILDNGTLERYIRDYAVTGLTSNPTIFDKAIGESDSYDADIRINTLAGVTGEELFRELAIEDLRRAADLFLPTHSATNGRDGWVSMEISPLLSKDTDGSIAAAKEIARYAERDNLFVKIPGTPEGIPAIEECIFSGIPINVTLLFSPDQYLSAAAAYLRGVERRLQAGRDPGVASVASLFISRWDVAANELLPEPLHNRLGLAIAQETANAYKELLASSRWQSLSAAGARPQRLLWASTGTKDPATSPTFYVRALVMRDTIDTVPEETLHALAADDPILTVMSLDRGEAERTVREVEAAGVSVRALASTLQEEGARKFVKSWQELLQRIAEKAGRLADKSRARVRDDHHDGAHR